MNLDRLRARAAIFGRDLSKAAEIAGALECMAREREYALDDVEWAFWYFAKAIVRRGGALVNAGGKTVPLGKFTPGGRWARLNAEQVLSSLLSGRWRHLSDAFGYLLRNCVEYGGAVDTAHAVR